MKHRQLGLPEGLVAPKPLADAVVEPLGEHGGRGIVGHPERRQHAACSGGADAVLKAQHAFVGERLALRGAAAAEHHQIGPQRGVQQVGHGKPSVGLALGPQAKRIVHRRPGLHVGVGGEVHKPGAGRSPPERRLDGVRIRRHEGEGPAAKPSHFVLNVEKVGQSRSGVIGAGHHQKRIGGGSRVRAELLRGRNLHANGAVFEKEACVVKGEPSDRLGDEHPEGQGEERAVGHDEQRCVGRKPKRCDEVLV